MKKISLAFAFVLLLTMGCETIDPSESGNLVAKTVDEDATLPNVILSKTKLHIQKYGQADSTKIFVLEGGPGSDFKYLLDLNKQVGSWSLLQNHEVIYFDYRGSGLSRRHPSKELTMDLLLKDFEELVNIISPNKKIIIIAHSTWWYLGGSVYKF
jgi:proline iminopeptidase